jgi:hypothetical protein
MTEAEWLACKDPEPMLEFLGGKASDRKLRLLAVASCRRIWTLLPMPCQNCTDVLGRFADGLATDDEYQAAYRQAEFEAVAADRDPPDSRSYAAASPLISKPPTVPSVTLALDNMASAMAYAVAESAADSQYDTAYAVTQSQEKHEQVRLVLDIFGNPFRPVHLDQRWVTPTAASLAQAVYDDWLLPAGNLDSARLPILADALEDAGCTERTILDHCRGPGPHVRGCWVVDLILGKQ